VSTKHQHDMQESLSYYPIIFSYFLPMSARQKIYNGLMKFIMWFGIIVGGLTFLLFAGIPLFLGFLSLFNHSISTNPPIFAALNGDGLKYFIFFIFGSFIAAFIGLIVLLIVGGIYDFRIKRNLRKIGKPATATILEIKDTGITLNKNPLVELTVETKNHIKGTIRMYVSRIAIPTIGDTVDILYNPEKPSQMCIAN